MTPLYFYYLFFFWGGGVGGFVSWGYFSSVGDGIFPQIGYKPSLDLISFFVKDIHNGPVVKQDSSVQTCIMLLYNMKIIKTPYNNES